MTLSTLIRPILVFLIFTPIAIASVNGPFLPLNKKFEGTFSKAKEIYFFNYLEKETCLEDNGRWDTEDEICFFDSNDDIIVKKTAANLYNVEVLTMGTNGHQCTFEATASPLNSNTLRASAQATVINPESGEWEPATCEVFLYYVGDSITVEDNGNCREYCGARAYLFIEGATRK